MFSSNCSRSAPDLFHGVVEQTCLLTAENRFWSVHIVESLLRSAKDFYEYRVGDSFNNSMHRTLGPSKYYAMRDGKPIWCVPAELEYHVQSLWLGWLERVVVDVDTQRCEIRLHAEDFYEGKPLAVLKFPDGNQLPIHVRKTDASDLVATREREDCKFAGFHVRAERARHWQSGYLRDLQECETFSMKSSLLADLVQACLQLETAASTATLVVEASSVQAFVALLVANPTALCRVVVYGTSQLFVYVALAVPCSDSFVDVGRLPFGTVAF